MRYRALALVGIATLQGLLGAGATAAQTSARFVIRRDTTLVDEKVAIVLTGARPGSPVAIRMSAPSQDAEATFIADRAGNVDLAGTAPVLGTYSGVEPMGLFWSARTAAPASNTGRPAGGGDPRRARPFQLTAEADGVVIAADTVWRRLVAPEVRITRLRDEGFTGTLYEPPPGTGRRAAVVVLSGAGGGTPGPGTWAGGLSSRGYVVLALAGWADEGVPAHQAGIPLEYFERAIRWLRARPDVDSSRVAALGGSKGGELALLLGATYPGLIRLVAAFVPSSVAWPGCCDLASRVTPGWTLGGKPVPHMPPDSQLESWVNAQSQASALRQAPLYLHRLADTAAAARAAIPVERIAGPVLLVSARDDGVWPSHPMSEQVVARLRQHGFRHPFQHLAYESAGHYVIRPYLPFVSVDAQIDSVRGRRNDFGGVPAMTARAQEESWQALLAFLARHLAGDERGDRPAAAGASTLWQLDDQLVRDSPPRPAKGFVSASSSGSYCLALPPAGRG